MPKTFHDKAYCTWCGNKLSPVAANELKCSSCSRSEYNNPQVSVAILPFNEKGELLIGIAKRDPGKGRQDTIGGFIDAGETAEEAAVREVQEEIGVTLRPEDLCDMKSYTNNTYLFGDIAYSIVEFFMYVDLPSTTQFTPGDDIESVLWLKPQAVDFEHFRNPDLAKNVQAYLRSQNML